MILIAREVAEFPRKWEEENEKKGFENLRVEERILLSQITVTIDITNIAEVIIKLDTLSRFGIFRFP